MEGGRGPVYQVIFSSGGQLFSGGRLWIFKKGSWFYDFLLFAFPDFPTFPTSPIFLLVCFSTSLFPCFSAFVLLCLAASTILPFLFFSHVFWLLNFLLFCFFASCLYCLSLCIFLFSFVLFFPFCIPNETLERERERERESLGPG